MSEPKADKSIIDPKYRVRKEPDWLATEIAKCTGSYKDVKVTKPNPSNPEEKLTTTETRADGVDIDKLFALAKANHLDVSKYEAQRGNAGFAGRFRMTLRNMLQAVVKQRHGLHLLQGAGEEPKFVHAPKDFLVAKNAPETPSHTHLGEKIAKPVEAEAEPKADKKPAKKAEAQAAA